MPTQLVGGKVREQDEMLKEMIVVETAGEVEKGHRNPISSQVETG